MKNCNGLDDSCEETVGPDYGLDRDGNIPKQPKSPAGCDKSVNVRDFRCKDFQLEKDDKSNDFIEDVVNEALNIAGATLNVFKLLGVHELSKLVDCTGRGAPVSNGDLPKYPASNAFDKYVTEWRSVQRGDGVTASAYIGYDFGNIKTKDNSRAAYGIETSIYKNVATMAIKQSSDASKRVTRARVERSDDGKKWFGAAVILLPDDDCLNTFQFRETVPSRYWRLRPLDFNGLENDYWTVVALQIFHNYVATDEYNIQDKVLLENRDRDYAEEAIPIKSYYDLTDNLMELSIYGAETPSMILYMSVSFSGCVAALGRPLVIGDIIEIPSEAQFSAKMEKILKWMEVTDVSWDTTGYTPGWKPTLLRIVSQPAFVSQETQDIFGDLKESEPDETGLVTGEDGQDQIYQDYFDVSKTIEAEARDAVPERGAEGSSTIREFEESEIKAASDQGVSNLQKIGLNSTGLYVEDAMPPNNAPFTEGDEYPSNPAHGDYHRLTYSNLAKDISARLYRYSFPKTRWIYLETDLRDRYNPVKPTLKEFITSPTSVDNKKITRNRETIDKDCEENP